jgi:hypothetical protein
MDGGFMFCISHVSRKTVLAGLFGLVLSAPIGADAQAAGMSQQSAAQTAMISASSKERTYSDNVVQVTATSQSNGALLVNVSVTGCTDPYNCIGGSVVSQ